MDDSLRFRQTKHSRSTSFSKTVEYVTYNTNEPNQSEVELEKLITPFTVDVREHKEIYDNSVFLNANSAFLDENSTLLNEISMRTILDFEEEPMQRQFNLRRKSLPPFFINEQVVDNNQTCTCNPLELIFDDTYEDQSAHGFYENNFPSSNHHRRSLSEVNEQKNFTCAECQMYFSRKHDLKRHLKTHSGVKPYICPLCTRSFSRNDALSRHQRRKSCCSE